jgi:DNA-directed RNA polymerase specialized sigma24 family protein
MSLNVSNEQFTELIKKAREGNSQPLNVFLRKLYEKGKYSLLQLAGSETEAEEYFSMAIAKFWEKFVFGTAPLPETNIGGYIYKMAKFACLDRKRSGIKPLSGIPVETLITKAGEPAELPKTEQEFRKEDQRESWRQEALKKAIAKLGENCRQLFQTVLDKGLEKPRELFAVLGLQNARAVTVLRYECTKQLKVKAALELERLVREGRE